MVPKSGCGSRGRRAQAQGSGLDQRLEEKGERVCSPCIGGIGEAGESTLLPAHPTEPGPGEAWLQS